MDEECALQHRLVVSDFTIKMEKVKKKAYIPGNRTWKLREPTLTKEF